MAQALPHACIDEPREASLGNSARIERLVREHFASLWRVARRWGLSEADADDVAQRSLVIAHQRLDEIAEGSERAFLFRTAIFLSTKIHRTRRRKPEESIADWDEQADSGPTPEQLLEQRRARAQLDAILSEMPDELRCVFVLFELENLGQHEIADMLGMPQGTVASRLRRAREYFLNALNRKSRAWPKAGAMP